MKRITFEVNDSFAKDFSNYCVENNTSKKSAIVNLLSKEMNKKGIMDQYANMNNITYIDFINEKNYKRLSKLIMEDEEFWEMNESLLVNKNINYYFEKDETLDSLLFFFKFI